MDSLGLEDVSKTAVTQSAQAHRMLQAYELLRSELRAFLKPEHVSAILDEACLAVDAEGEGDPLREMRAVCAARLLDQVGDFLARTALPPLEGPAEDDHPPYAGEDGDEELPTRVYDDPDETRDLRLRRAL